MTEVQVIEEQHKGCYVKQRYILCMLSFFGLCNVTFIRNHVGVTTLAMVNTISTNDSLAISNHTSKAEDTLGWSSFQQGYFLGAYFYGYSVGNFPGGMLVNKFGFRKVLFCSIFLSAVLEIFIPLAAHQSYYLALVLRSLEGFAQGPCLPGFISVWSNWAPPLEKSVLNSIALSGGLFGFLIILPVAGLIVNSFTWEFVFYFSGGLAIIWSCVFFCYATDTPETNPRITEEEKKFLKSSIEHSKISPLNSKRSIPWKAIFTSKCVYAHFLCHFADGWYQLAIPALLPTYMVMGLNYDVLQSSIVMTLPFLLQFLFAVVSGHVTDLLRAKKIFTTTTIRKINSCTAVFTSGTLIVLSSYCNDGIVVIAIFTVGFAISGLSYPGYLSNALDFAPSYAGVVFSISNTFAVSSGALAPLAAAYIVTDKTARSQWQSFFWLTFGLSCVGAIAFAIFGSGVQQEWSKIICTEHDDLEEKKDVDANLLPSSQDCQKNELA